MQTAAPRSGTGPAENPGSCIQLTECAMEPFGRVASGCLQPLRLSGRRRPPMEGSPYVQGADDCSIGCKDRFVCGDKRLAHQVNSAAVRSSPPQLTDDDTARVEYRADSPLSVRQSHIGDDAYKPPAIVHEDGRAEPPVNIDLVHPFQAFGAWFVSESETRDRSTVDNHLPFDRSGCQPHCISRGRMQVRPAVRFAFPALVSAGGLWRGDHGCSRAAVLGSTYAAPGERGRRM